MTADPSGDGRLLGRGRARAALALVLVHGRGAGAEDILALGATLAPADASFFAPEAAGRSWWPTSFLAPMAQLEPWLGSGLATVARAADAANAEGFGDDRILLLGFSQGASQGACRALEYAARAARPFRGVFGLSGALVGHGGRGRRARPRSLRSPPEAVSGDTANWPSLLRHEGLAPSLIKEGWSG